jgi:hypothetical protein
MVYSVLLPLLFLLGGKLCDRGTKAKVVRGSVQFLSPIQSSFYSPALFRISAPKNFSVQGIIGRYHSAYFVKFEIIIIVPPPGIYGCDQSQYGNINYTNTIVFLRYGFCDDSVKSLTAQLIGAAGVIITNIDESETPLFLFYFLSCGEWGSLRY